MKKDSCITKYFLGDITVGFLLWLLVFTTAIAYWPGLNGPFLFDDFPNLEPLNRFGGVDSWRDALVFVFTNESGALGRPVSMLSFLISDQAWPGDPSTFKYVNLMLHCLIGVLVFYLVYRLCKLVALNHTSSLLVGLCVAAGWTLNPFNVSTTLYVVQRMNQLATLFTLLALIFYLIARVRTTNLKNSGYLFLVLSLIFTGLSILSKENGVLTFLYIVLLECLLFVKSERTLLFNKLYILGVVSPLILFVLYLFLSFGNMQADYQYRDFSMAERLLTQPRVIFEYLSRMLLVDNLGTGLFHDDFPVSMSLLKPVSTLLSLLGLIGLGLLAFISRHKLPLLSFGILIFLAGHSLESSFLPLEMYFEHRNYFPMIGVFISFAALLLSLQSLISETLSKIIMVAVFAVFSFGAAAVTVQKATLWGNEFNLYTMWATEHPQSLRAQRHYGGYLGRTELWAREGEDVLSDAFELHPNSLSLPLRMMSVACQHDIETTASIETLVRNSVYKEEDGAVTLALLEFADLHLFGLCNGIYGEDEIIDLLRLFSQSKQLPGRSKSRINSYLSDVYKKKGNLYKAVLYLDEVKRYSKNYSISLQQAQYLASAGLHEDALTYIDEARVLDRGRKRPWVNPSNEVLIDRLEKHIVNLRDRKLENSLNE